MLSTFSILPSPKVCNKLVVYGGLLMDLCLGVRNYRGGAYLVTPRVSGALNLIVLAV